MDFGSVSEKTSFPRYPGRSSSGIIGFTTKKSKEYEMKYDLLKDGRRKEVPKKLRKVLFWIFFK
jgi:hypothetical protein